MIAKMLDLAEIDRQLEQLGKTPEDCAPLLDHALGANRSLERIDALLATLAQSVLLQSPAPKRRPSSHPPRAMGRHARWTPPPGGVAPRAKSGSARDTLVGPPTSHPPAPTDSLPAPLPRDEAELVLSDAGYEGEPELSFADAVEGSELEAETRVAPADDAETGRRPSMEALLDQHLDPDDFPKTPPPPAASEDEATAADEDDFELLIEDEEILEVEDDDVVDDDEA